KPALRRYKEARIHVHGGNVRVRHMRNKADAGGKETRILGRAVDRSREIGREGAADRRDIDPDFFEDLSRHHAAHAASAFAGLKPLGLAVPGRVGETRRAACFGFDRLEFGADAVAQRLEPVAGGLLLGIERNHPGKPFVCLRASASAMPAATATFKERKPGCIGIAIRAAAAAWTCAGTPEDS